MKFVSKKVPKDFIIEVFLRSVKGVLERRGAFYILLVDYILFYQIIVKWFKKL
jgi:hypothetical protein